MERPFEEVLGPNLRGLYHVYEAARREGARVIFASSNHSIGFHERPTGNRGQARLRLRLPARWLLRAVQGLWRTDGPAVLGQAWRRERQPAHRVVLPEADRPPDAVHLAVLCGPDAAGGTLRASRRACGPCGDLGVFEQSGHPIGGEDHRDRIGWAPQDSAEPFRAEVERITADPITSATRAAASPTMEYSRATPSPRDPFALDD